MGNSWSATSSKTIASRTAPPHARLQRGRGVVGLKHGPRLPPHGASASNGTAPTAHQPQHYEAMLRQVDEARLAWHSQRESIGSQQWPSMKNIVGPRIREARHRTDTKVSQELLAARIQSLGLNIDRTAISKIETGRRYVSDVRQQSSNAEAIKRLYPAVVRRIESASLEDKQFVLDCLDAEAAIGPSGVKLSLAVPEGNLSSVYNGPRGTHGDGSARVEPRLHSARGWTRRALATCEAGTPRTLVDTPMGAC